MTPHSKARRQSRTPVAHGETPYSPLGILRQALAFPFGRRPRWLPKAVAPSCRLWCAHKSKKGVAESKYELGDRSQNSEL
ncbi:hypothetical protein [uncultured Nostoc sp.]|uniref:hypothetical protein n=1 Tax=uncultured Nostoc sp. TaxID=340711 RepID=UPI0026111082|nr:hypothetical protein [uncultured Nostoc sp.]